MAVDFALVATQLAEARFAYHQLMVGGVARVFVDQNGERIEYNNFNAAALRAYILYLEAMLVGVDTRPQPMRFFF